MIDLVTKNLERIQAACRKFDVDTLWIFGSAVNDDWVPGKSDVDFIANFGESDRSIFRQHMGFIVQLEDILGVRVEVVDFRSISKPTFREEVERTRIQLYERAQQTVSA